MYNYANYLNFLEEVKKEEEKTSFFQGILSLFLISHCEVKWKAPFR